MDKALGTSRKRVLMISEFPKEKNEKTKNEKNGKSRYNLKTRFSTVLRKPRTNTVKAQQAGVTWVYTFFVFVFVWAQKKKKDREDNRKDERVVDLGRKQ